MEYYSIFYQKLNPNHINDCISINEIFTNRTAALTTFNEIIAQVVNENYKYKINDFIFNYDNSVKISNDKYLIFSTLERTNIYNITIYIKARKRNIYTLYTTDIEYIYPVYDFFMNKHEFLIDGTHCY